MKTLYKTLFKPEAFENSGALSFSVDGKYFENGDSRT